MIIHADKLRWLFWLRWKIFLRAFTRGSGRVAVIIGRIFLLLFGLGVGGGIAVVSFLAYRYLPAPANAEVLFLTLTGIFVLWMVLPLLEFSTNEGLDPSKLSLFPLTRAELMVSLLFSTVLDLPMIGVFLVLAATIAGYALSLPLALVTLLGMLIFCAACGDQSTGTGSADANVAESPFSGRDDRCYSCPALVFWHPYPTAYSWDYGR